MRKLKSSNLVDTISLVVVGFGLGIITCELLNFSSNLSLSKAEHLLCVRQSQIQTEAQQLNYEMKCFNEDVDFWNKEYDIYFRVSHQHKYKLKSPVWRK